MAGVEDEVVVEAGKESYTRPEEVEEFVSRTDVTLLQLQSVLPTVRISLRQLSVQEMLMVFLFPRRFGSTYWKSVLSVFPDSRLFFTVPHPFRRSSLRWLTSLAAICLMQ